MQQFYEDVVNLKGLKTKTDHTENQIFSKADLIFGLKTDASNSSSF